MTEDGRLGDGPGPETSPTPLLETLDVRRKARTGVVAGVVVGVLAYLVFVVARGQPAPVAALYLVSVFVVASSTAVLVTVALVVRTVVRATVDLGTWVRRGGTIAAAGGGLLATLTVVGPAVSRIAGDGLRLYFGEMSIPVAPLYDWLVPACTVALLCGAWALHAAHRSRAGYGRLGLLGWVVTATATLLAWWVTAVEVGPYRGARLESLSPLGFLVVFLALAVGTGLLGAASLRAGAMPIRGPLLALFAPALTLTGLTVVLGVDTTGLVAAYLDPPAPSAVALTTPTALAWVLFGLDLRAGRGVPSADTLGIDLVTNDRGPESGRESGSGGGVRSADPTTSDSDER